MRLRRQNCTGCALVLCGIYLLSQAGCGRAAPMTNSQSVQVDASRSGALGLPNESRVTLNLSENLLPSDGIQTTEEYDAITENPFRLAIDEPQSTFAIDVDTAAYSNIRRMLSQGQMPPPGAVRIEELVNYFNYDYAEPAGEHPFSVNTELAECPWNSGNCLLRIGLRGKAIEFDKRPASNLVFLLDVSGSMQQPNKLPLVKSALEMLVRNLDERDRIAIVVYAGASGLVLDSTSVNQSDRIMHAVDTLQAGGSTNGGEGIELAYRVATEHFIPDGVNRVLLCTDGDFNVGATDRSSLLKLIEQKALNKVFLSVLGFGTSNLKDSTLEQIADHGNGNYAYIDSPLEARKVLVEQLSGTLLTIAKDVKIQVDFNPRRVQSYRLLGYENRLMANEDFRNDGKDAGEIGAGHTVTAFYEIVPVGSEPSEKHTSRPSEFVVTSVRPDADTATWLTVNLRYKEPETDLATEFQTRVERATPIHGTQSEDFRFASAVVGYGLLLRNQGQPLNGLDWDWVINTAEATAGEDSHGLRQEFVRLARTARRIKSTLE